MKQDWSSWKGQGNGGMSKTDASTLEIYIGNPVQYESERSTLRGIECLLAAESLPAVVFANFSAACHQIDILVALESLALVIEVKAGTHPVRGGENGPWQIHLASGDWKDFRNPYLQILDGALALKDVMREFCNSPVPYIRGAVVFAPEIPCGSNAFQSNRKVSVIGHEGMRGQLRNRSNNAWSLAEWRRLAKHLGLTPVSSIAAACDPSLVEAEDRILQYSAMFYRTYHDAENLIPFPCKSHGGSIPSSDVTDLVSTHCRGLLLHGPAGCGKSMVAAKSGIEFIRRGGVALVVQSKDFEGRLREVLDREAGLLGVSSAMRLLTDARRLGKPILFVVDGYNECVTDRQGMLTRAISALARWYEGGLLVTSRVPLARGDLLDLQKIDVSSPSMETKMAIARQASQQKALADNVKDLLAAISSGLEARLVGDIGNTVGPGSSRYTLFDAYARNRLGEMSGECVRALSLVAARFFDRIVFSMSVRDLDRLMDRNGVSAVTRQLILDRGMLALRGDRVSFPHELFLDAFAAEAIVRQSNDQPEGILKALATPSHAARKDLIIGAIDDDSLLARLLPRLADHASVKACLLGRCGNYAREWAQEHYRKLWERLRDEAHEARFRIEGQGSEVVEFDERLLHRWTPCDRVYFTLLPELMVEGRYLDQALEVVGVLDRRIADEWLRLRDIVGIGNIRIRNQLFAMSYLYPSGLSSAPGISTICADITSGVFLARSGSFRRTDDAGIAIIKRKLFRGGHSPGQLYLLLELCRGRGVPAWFLTRSVKKQWKDSPYHLRLALLGSAAMNCTGEDADRAELIEAIEELLRRRDSNVPDIVLQTLQQLGALDDAARDHEEVVREEVLSCLARPTESASQLEAWRIYSAQFDHPYSAAYCEIVSGLADRERKTLLHMAAKGAPETAFWLGQLLLELASFGDRDVGESIAPWTALPPVDNRSMPQSDIHAFVAAHRALARLGCPLPKNPRVSDVPSAVALKAYGAILYWSNRMDLDDEVRRRACKHGLDVLAQEGRTAAVDVIRECEHLSGEGFRLLSGDAPVAQSVVAQFPAEVVTICRNALRDPKCQVGYFRYWSKFDRQPILQFAIDVLKRYGNAADRGLLRQYTRSREYGKDAIAALKAIEQREMGHAGRSA